MRLSSSKMDSYEWCPRKYRLQHIENIKLPYISKPLIIGSKTHKFIENFWKNCSFSLKTYIEDINAYLNKELKKVSLVERDKYISSTLQVYYSNFVNFQIRRIKTYINEYDNDEKMIKKLFYPYINETYGTLNIANKHTFGFIIDSGFWNPNGNVLIDWKTDFDCTESQFRTHIPQLKRYSVCARDVLKENFEKLGIFFVKDFLYFSIKIDRNYSLEDEVINFIRMLQTSKYPKVSVEESWKCCSPNNECEYYPKVCKGAMVKEK